MRSVVRVRGPALYRARAVVLTTGTFLQAIMHTGEAKTAGGRAGEGTSGGLSESLRLLGFELDRFKTGTPARLTEHPGATHAFLSTPGVVPQARSARTEIAEFLRGHLAG